MNLIKLYSSLINSLSLIRLISLTRIIARYIATNLIIILLKDINIISDILNLVS